MSGITQVQEYFQKHFTTFGEQALGVNWNSPAAQETRFDQLLKVIQPEDPYTILDYGCGYGALATYMRKAGYSFDHFYGYDIVLEAIEKATQNFSLEPTVSFHNQLDEIPPCDYLTASGVFNICVGNSPEEWQAHILDSLRLFDRWSIRGFSVNFLTTYSDPERMAERPDLFFTDPTLIFDFCRRNFSRNVALLHDYKIWDFTIIVRKEND